LPVAAAEGLQAAPRALHLAQQALQALGLQALRQLAQQAL
jgi:HPt (histidine-containing phosphotransfer) domain-containing protein